MGKESNRRKINNTLVNTIQFEGDKEYTIWDSEIRGFGLRLLPSGKMSFVLWYRFRGRARRLTLGSADQITAEIARNAAKKAIVSISDNTDPAERKQDDKKSQTVNDLCALFLEDWAKPRKKTWEEDERRMIKHIRPSLGKRPVNSIEDKDIIKFHARIGKTSPYEANRVLSLLSKMFEFAKKNGFLKKNDLNPAKGIEKFPERKRDRWAKDEELQRLLHEIEKLPNELHRSGLQLYLLTGMRNRSLMSRQRDDLIVKKILDVKSKMYSEQGYIRLRETKSGDPILLPLSSAALEIFLNIPIIENSPWFFPSPNPEHHLAEFPRKIWYRIRIKTGVPDLRIHDLRRTYGSLLASSGVSIKVIAGLLDQSTESITDTVYAHLADSATREATESIVKNIIPFCEIKKKSADAS
jgi:integrase